MFYRQVPVNNASASQYAEVKITGVKNNVGPNGEDAITEETRALLVAATPETFSHDADGNLTGDARWIYIWDGENRLIGMETSASAIAAGVSRKKLEFTYDGLGRRIAKKVYDWDGTAWVLGASTRFLYDGWNLLAELNALDANAVVRTYAWGLDLSGSAQGAGGVGGLLFADLPLQTTTHAPAFDGNGNVIAYVDLATGSKSATYEYGAFGETLIADGATAEAIPFRFSTKFTDNETGLLYYGLRYYSPGMGRWLSRDPIYEIGGANVYTFVSNTPTEFIDYLGENRMPVRTPQRPYRPTWRPGRDIRDPELPEPRLPNIERPNPVMDNPNWPFTDPRDIRPPSDGGRTWVDDYRDGLEREKRARDKPRNYKFDPNPMRTSWACCVAIIGETFDPRVIAAKRVYPNAETFDIVEQNGIPLTIFNRAWIRSIMKRNCLIIDIGFDYDRGTPENPHGKYYELERQETQGYFYKAFHQFPASSELRINGIWGQN